MIFVWSVVIVENDVDFLAFWAIMVLCFLEFCFLEALGRPFFLSWSTDCLLTVCKNVSKVSFGAKDIDVLEWKGDLLAVGVTEKDVAKDENSKFKNPILNKLDSRLGGLLSEASAEEDFTGKVGQSTVLRFSGLGTKRVSLIGLGKSASNVAAFRSLGETVAVAAKASQASDVAISLASPDEHSSVSKPNIASAIASGTRLFLAYG